MHTKKFDTYIKFLEFAKKNKKELKNIKYTNGRLLSYKTNSYNCSFAFNNGNLTPSKFCKMLGVSNYSFFCKKYIDKLKDFEDIKNAKKWWGGYFGGLIGVNEDIINNYVGNGEIFSLFDYDINSAYMYALTDFLPTKFAKKITYNEYLQLNKIDKIPYIYFFELDLKELKGSYFSIFLHPKKIYRSFDFINSKQVKNIIVSERRLSLINQIYFKEYEIKSIYVFERHKYSIFDNILFEYMKVKNNDKTIKKNALKIYGTFGKLKNRIIDKIYFYNDILYCNGHTEFNADCSPQVAMWVADSVALRLFDIVSSQLDKIIAWNTDGLISTVKLNLKTSKRAGDFKLTKICGMPFILSRTGKHLIIYDIISKNFHGGDTFKKVGNKIIQEIDFFYSSLKKGYTKRTKQYIIDTTIKYESKDDLRTQVLLDYIRKNIINEQGFEYNDNTDVFKDEKSLQQFYIDKKRIEKEEEKFIKEHFDNYGNWKDKPKNFL